MHLCSAMFEKKVVVDGRGHLLGRLASVVAKELLSGAFLLIWHEIICYSFRGQANVLSLFALRS